MPRGSKAKYTAKQRRKAHSIEESAKKRGFSSKRAAQIGYATVNKQEGGGKAPGGSGRGKTRKTTGRKRTPRGSSRTSR
jgi:hypothetical protein